MFREDKAVLVTFAKGYPNLAKLAQHLACRQIHKGQRTLVVRLLKAMELGKPAGIPQPSLYRLSASFIAVPCTVIL